MAAGATYTPIATTTLGSSQASVTFSSFSGYTDLVCVVSGTMSSTGNFYLQFNSDTGSNYSVTELYGDGTSAVSSRYSSQTYAFCGLLGTAQGNAVIQIQNYANTSTNKTFLARGNYPSGYTIARVGLWRSTSAITSITFAQASGFTFQTGSTFTLYGIASA